MAIDNIIDYKPVTLQQTTELDAAVSKLSLNGSMVIIRPKIQFDPHVLEAISEKDFFACVDFAHNAWGMDGAQHSYCKKDTTTLPRTVVLTGRCFYILLKTKNGQEGTSSFTARRTTAICVSRHDSSKISLVDQLVNSDESERLSMAELYLRNPQRFLGAFHYNKDKNGTLIPKTMAFIESGHSDTCNPAKDGKNRDLFKEADTLLHHCIDNGDGDSMRFLRKQGIPDDYRKMAIQRAAAKGNMELLSLLVLKDDSPKQLQYAYVYAIENNHYNVVEFLLGYGCEEIAEGLSIAISRNYLDIARLLLTKAKQSSETITKALAIAAHKNNMAAFWLVLKYKDEEIKIGPEALRWAVVANQEEMVQELVRRMQPGDEAFSVAVWEAVRTNNDATLEFLFASGANKSSDLGYAFRRAAEVSPELVDKVRGFGEISREDQEAAFRNASHVAVVAYLFKMMPDINKQVIFEAAKLHAWEKVEFLVEQGFPLQAGTYSLILDVCDDRKLEPQEQQRLVTLLLDHGADTQVKNGNGDTVVCQVAQHIRGDKIVALLLSKRNYPDADKAALLRGYAKVTWPGKVSEILEKGVPDAAIREAVTISLNPPDDRCGNNVLDALLAHLKAKNNLNLVSGIFFDFYQTAAGKEFSQQYMKVFRSYGFKGPSAGSL